jgi:hypothetical protein
MIPKIIQIMIGHLEDKTWTEDMCLPYMRCNHKKEMLEYHKGRDNLLEHLRLHFKTGGELGGII